MKRLIVGLLLSASPFAILPIVCSAANKSETAVIEQDGVHLKYATSVPRIDVIYALGEAIYARAVVTRFLHRPLKKTLMVELIEEQGIPFTSNSQIIQVPYGRLRNRKPGVDPLNLVHETTHVLATGPDGADRLLTEGLAVYVQTLLGPPAYPNFGSDLHQATADLQAANDTEIPILKSEQVRETSDHGPTRALAYTQEGSFARWLIETRGLDSFLKVLDGADAKKIYGYALDELEPEWRAMLNTLPQPVPTSTPAKAT